MERLIIGLGSLGVVMLGYHAGKVQVQQYNPPPSDAQVINGLEPWATAPDGFIILGVDGFGRVHGPPGYYGYYWGRIDMNENGWLRSSDGHAWRIINGQFYNP